MQPDKSVFDVSTSGTYTSLSADVHRDEAVYIRGVAGRGKRGGVRVIYYLRSHLDEIWMLTVYAKNEEASIPGHVLKKIKEAIDGGG